MSGASFGAGLNAGLNGAGMGLITGGIMGGISGGINSAIHHGNFLTGEGARFDELASTANVSNNTGNEVNYDQTFTDKFANENMDIGREDHVNNLYADGSIPSGYTKKGDAVLNDNGFPVRGTNVYHRVGDDVYLYKAAYSSKELLYETMLHEYIHAGFNHTGYAGYTAVNEHASIYKFQYNQAAQWGDQSLMNIYYGRYSQYFNQSYYNLIESQLGFNLISTRPIIP